MFGDYVLEQTSAEYENRILILDDEGLEEMTHYSADFKARGFEVVCYKDDLSFRIEYEDKVKSSGGKIVVMANSGTFIPYDIYCMLRSYVVSMSKLFPKLNSEVLREERNLDLELLCSAYKDNFDMLTGRSETENFIHLKVYSQYNVRIYIEKLLSEIKQLVHEAKNYQDWILIAEQKAKVDVLATGYQIVADTRFINNDFQEWVLQNFGKLSTELNKDTPILVSKAMEYMHDHSEKFVVIVMDGMSQFDWRIISRSFEDVFYEQTALFAMIPTTTSISRQCLLSNKSPIQLIEPWRQNKEKMEFVTWAKSAGYADNQIAYERGYDVELGSFVRCGAIIINDVDDMVHAQHQERLGMYNDISVLASQQKLVTLTKRLLKQGLDVYITADHGNTLCTGLGMLRGTGLEVETKSRRMLVLQDFANKASLKEKYGLIEYPKYYLNKKFDYLICDIGKSFDTKGETVMTHGGISIDEVIVPFIKVKAGKKNG